jgi:hypothetical protein
VGSLADPANAVLTVVKVSAKSARSGIASFDAVGAACTTRRARGPDACAWRSTAASRCTIFSSDSPTCALGFSMTANAPAPTASILAAGRGVIPFRTRSGSGGQDAAVEIAADADGLPEAPLAQLD